MNHSKVLAIILTITMCLAMLPAGAYAEDPPASGEGTGTLTISSSPAGADVYIDDVLQTVATPADLDLAPGSYNLKLSIPGYENFTDTVVIQEGQTTAIDGVVQLPDLIEPAAGNITTSTAKGTAKHSKRFQ